MFFPPGSYLVKLANEVPNRALFCKKAVKSENICWNYHHKYGHNSHGWPWKKNFHHISKY